MPEINYGLDPIEVIIRLTPDNVIEFNKLNDFSIDQIKADVSGKELYCHFQKISDTEHKIFIPSFNGQFEAIVKWYSVADTYQAIVDKKKKTIYRTAILTPQADKSIAETCFVKIIDINEGGKANRASDEFEELYKSVCKQTIVSNINIQSQQEIWFKWIEAQRAIIQKLQEPLEIIGKPTVKIKEQSFNDAIGRPMIAYEVSVNLKETITSEYVPLEIALKGYDIKPSLDKLGFPKKDLFDPDGTILLTNEEIETVLDPLIKSQFSEIFERENEMQAIIKIENRIDFEIARLLWKNNLNLKTAIDIESNLLSIYGNPTKYNNQQSKYRQNSRYYLLNIPDEIVKRFHLVRKNIVAKIKKTNPVGELEFETIDRLIGPNADIDKIENIVRNLKSEILNKFEEYRSQGYRDLTYQVAELFSYQLENFDEDTFDENFEQSIKRSLIPYKDAIEFNPKTNHFIFNFENKEEFEEYTKFLKSLKQFKFNRDPESPLFKFKVKTNFIAKKTQKQLFYDKLSKLRGAEFVSDLNKKEEKVIVETEETTIQKKIKKTDFQYLGNLNSRLSNLKKLTFYIPSFFPNQKDIAETVKQFIEGNGANKVKFVQANLKGDEAKNSWLVEAVNKITNPTEELNGKPINENLGNFLIDTSKASPIVDENKVTVGSEFYHKVKNNELLKLNESQRKAVLASIHCSDLALLQGPPGTGKTTVIAEIIWQIICQNQKHKVLLTSENNLAVDNALDRLLNVKGVNPNLADYITLIKPLRFVSVGKPGETSKKKIDEEGAKYSVDRIMSWLDSTYVAEETDDEVIIEESDEDFEEDEEKGSVENNAVQDWMKRIAGRAKNTDPKYAAALKDWAMELSYPKPEVKILFKEKYFEYCNIIGSTCSSSGSATFKREFSKLSLQKLFINYLKSEKYKESISDINYQLKKGIEDDDFTIVDSICRRLRIKEFELTILLATPTYSFIQSLFFSDINRLSFIKDKIPAPRPLPKLLTRLGFENLDEANTFLNQCNTISFDTVIMDEASKATPPEMLLPLCFGKRSIVIGDHRQLPPMLNEKDFKEALEDAGATELAAEIDQEFLETSQFERMILNENISPTVFARCNIQYRMHPDINEVIKQFYIDDGGLEAADELKQGANENYATGNLQKTDNTFSRHHGLNLKGFISPDVHTMWVNVEGEEKREGTSIYNEHEIEAVQKIIKLIKQSEGFNDFQSHWDFIKDDFKRLQEQQIGVITFYGEQKKKLKTKLAGIDKLKINSVDKFQGMERNIIIVSTVRSDKQFMTKSDFNSRNDFRRKNGQPNITLLEDLGVNVIAANDEIGFAKLPQRLNVALSRAKRLLIVVGNKNFFQQFTDSKGKPLYKNAISEIEKNGKIIEANQLSKLLR
jgi:DNA polymerase III delta prime subunit